MFGKHNEIVDFCNKTTCGGRIAVGFVGFDFDVRERIESGTRRVMTSLAMWPAASGYPARRSE
jgi:hypothetical protein